MSPAEKPDSGRPTRRIRLFLPVSATYRLPSAPSAMPAGYQKLAAVGHRSDDPVGTHPPDALVRGIRDVQAAVAGDRDAIWPQARRDGRAAIAAKVIGPRAGHRGDDPVGAHPPDPSVTGIRDVQA